MKSNLLKLLLVLNLIIILSICSCSGNRLEQKIFLNEMTEKEQKELSILSQNDFTSELMFYDEELDSKYLIEIKCSADYDPNKPASVLIVLGRELLNSSYNAIDSYAISGNSQIITLTLKYPEDTDYDINRAMDSLGITPLFRGALTDNDIRQMHEFALKANELQSFLTTNVMGWLCDNYQIDTTDITLAGFDYAGYFAIYSLINKNPFSNYLVVNPKTDMETDELGLIEHEENYYKENESLWANLYFINAGDEISSNEYEINSELFKSLEMREYEKLDLNYTLLDGLSINTIFNESLIRGLCMFDNIEYDEYYQKIVSQSKTITDTEIKSINISALSSDHIYYNEVVSYDSESAEYIKELTIYDEEIDDTFVVHISLPPEYDENTKYPILLMTDGVWRLSDHPELRKLMVNNEIEDIILVSVGYPNDYDVMKIRERDLVQQPDLYLQFLVENLMPYLCDVYSIDESNTTLTGHSYGGYWALYALFHSDTIGKGIFKNYYIGSPSPMTSTRSNDIYSFEAMYNNRNNTLDSNVYITVGGQETSFLEPVGDLVDFIKNREYKNLQITYEVIDGYGHNDVFKPSIDNTVKMFYLK